MQGGDLDGKVAEHKKKKTRIPEAQVVEWIIQLLLAVQYMHDRWVTHIGALTNKNWPGLMAHTSHSIMSITSSVCGVWKAHTRAQI